MASLLRMLLKRRKRHDRISAIEAYSVSSGWVNVQGGPGLSGVGFLLAC